MVLHPAELAKEEELERVHNSDFVRSFVDGTLSSAAMRRIGFPHSPELVKRTLASAGSTLAAARSALSRGFGGTLAGGTHHASRNEGAGFCVFNDLAIAIEMARVEYGLQRAAIVDLDVHQGDGTASIFKEDQDVFTLSLHGDRNFPFRKQTSTLDVALPDGADDAMYIEALRPALARVLAFRPGLILFQSGVDALATDSLGRLALTAEGLRARDRLVIGEVQKARIPLVITMGGGYSNPIELTVEAHAHTFWTAAEFYSREAAHA